MTGQPGSPASTGREGEKDVTAPDGCTLGECSGSSGAFSGAGARPPLGLLGRP